MNLDLPLLSISLCLNLTVNNMRLFSFSMAYLQNSVGGNEFQNAWKGL